jgi:hypothetical protein
MAPGRTLHPQPSSAVPQTCQTASCGLRHPRTSHKMATLMSNAKFCLGPGSAALGRATIPNPRFLISRVFFCPTPGVEPFSVPLQFGRRKIPEVGNLMQSRGLTWCKIIRRTPEVRFRSSDALNRPHRNSGQMWGGLLTCAPIGNRRYGGRHDRPAPPAI